MFQSKQNIRKTSQSVGQKFRGKLKFTRRARLPPLTHPETTKPHLHTCSSTSILSQRERTHDSDLLIYQFLQLNPKMMWVQMDGDPRPRQPGGTSWQSAWDEERNKERRKRTTFHQVRVESQLLACWWVSQNSELLSWEKPATVCWTRTANELPSHTQSASVLAPSASNVAPRESNLYMSGVHLDCTENVVPLIKTCQQNDDVVGLAYPQRADLCSLGVKPFFFFSFFFSKIKQFIFSVNSWQRCLEQQRHCCHKQKVLLRRVSFKLMQYVMLHEWHLVVRNVNTEQQTQDTPHIQLSGTKNLKKSW